MESPTQQRRGDWCQTHTGTMFWHLDVRTEDVHLDDITHALSHVARYGGHAPEDYKVGQHSVLVSIRVGQILRLMRRGGTAGKGVTMETVRMGERAGLLHDAAEAFIGDMVRPLKRNMPAFTEAEDAIMLAVCHRFGLPEPEEDELLWWAVRKADEELLATEAEVFFPPELRPQAWTLNAVPVPELLPRHRRWHNLFRARYAWRPPEIRERFAARAAELDLG